MSAAHQYPAKLLLFGEHVVLTGADAVAVPLNIFGVDWQQGREPDERLRQLLDFLRAENFDSWLDLTAFNREVSEGWQLVGNVPHGYGLGSSGTVCAAVWGRYSKQLAAELSPLALRPHLARMEAFYHGNSSGTDPLISFTGLPWHLQADRIQSIHLPENWRDHFFLVDTHQDRKAAPLIQAFKERLAGDISWKSRVNQLWKPASSDCISALLRNEQEQLKDAFLRLSRAQFALVPDLIPEAFRSRWVGQYYQLKLCGAGGGGFLLAYTTNRAAALKELEDCSLLNL